MMDRPSDSVVFRNNDRTLLITVRSRYNNGAVYRIYFDVPVNARAVCVRRRIDLDNGSKCHTSVVAASAAGRRKLRAIVDGVRVRRRQLWYRRVINTATERLMINARADTESGRWNPCHTVVISVGSLARRRG